jgi:hypothetical protein
MTGRRFEGVDLTGARFRDLDMTGARFEHVTLSGTVMRGVEMIDVDIDGRLGNVTINGVDVMPLVQAELDRRFPERVALRPRDPAGFREAWDIVERLWAGTVARARTLDPELLHESVDGEWSFIQTLRHLVFATDSWVLRALQGDPYPYDPLDLPFSEMGEIEGVPNDVDARPSLDEVLALRAGRMAIVSDVIEHLTDEQLAGSTTPVEPIGYPESESHPVRRCLGAIVIEEWEHHLFANRDLAVLESSA